MLVLNSFGGVILNNSPERPPISKRELEIARAYTNGKTYREIADDLGIAPATVRTHINNIYRKLEVSSKIELLHRISQENAPGPRALNWQLPALALAALSLLAGAVMIRETPTPPQAPAAIQSLALVPFSHDGSHGIRDTLTRDLADSLTSRARLSVVRPSNLRLTIGGNVHASRLARELNLRFVLFGHIASNGEGLSGWASLYDFAMGQIVWHDEFVSAEQDILGVRRSMLDSLAQAIDLPETSTLQLGCRELREKETQVYKDRYPQPIYEVEGQPSYCRREAIGPR